MEKTEVAQRQQVRRKGLNQSIFKRDYFILLGLNNFLKRSIQQYVKKDHKVLDMGCGSQPFRELVEAEGAHYLGCDIVQNEEKSVDVISSFESFAFSHNTFDVVICSEVLEHVINPQDAIKKLAHCVKPGGFIILTTPFSYPLHEEPFDFCRLSPHFFKKISSELSLRLEYYEKSGNNWTGFATHFNFALFESVKHLSLLKPVRVAITFAINTMFNVTKSSRLKQYYLSNLCIYRKT